MNAPRHEPDEPDQKPLIELSPLTPKQDLPPGGKYEDRWVATEQQIETSESTVPVPAVPLHLCPSCDYNLTGLTARRCPECGEPFTLPDARDRGVEKAVGFRRYFVTERYEQWKLRTGWALLAASFLLPILWRQSARGTLGLRGGVMLVFIPIFLTFACFYKVIRDTTWADAILVVGLGAAMLGAAITFL